MKPSRRLFYVHVLNVAVAAILCAALPVALRAQGEGDAEKRPPGSARHYALLIGINNYKSLPRLKTAEDDAREVERVLRGQYAFDTKLLLNATRQQIIAALNSYRRQLDENSNLLIYYAGHGYNDREAEKAYWLPVDAARDDVSNWISADDITTNIKTIPSRHVLIVSDSCYSGTLTRGIGTPSVNTPSLRERYLEKMSAGKSRTLLSSGGNEPVADGGGGKHSVFASALLRGLNMIGEGQFTADELFRAYIQENVAGRVDQTPEYNALRNSGHESGDFVFVRKGAAAGPGVNSAPASGASPASQGVKPGAADATRPQNVTPSEETGGLLRDDASLAGTTWTGSSPEAGRYQINFLKDGQLRYVINVWQNGVNSPRTIKGEWRQEGNSIQITIGDAYSVLQGVIDGNTMKGEGSNREGLKWNWTLFKQQ